MKQNSSSISSCAPVAVRRAWALAVALAVGLSLASSAQAQDAPPPAEPPPVTETVPSGNRPGFLEALGRFFGHSKDAIDSQFKNTQETLGNIGTQATGAAKNAAGAAKDAAGSVIALPGTRIVTGRQLCPVAANGAPDCQQGASALCNAKGFQGGGRSLDIQTSQRCPIKSWLQGPKEGECRSENYVTRAVCQ
jgi:hypothetical protein